MSSIQSDRFSVEPIARPTNTRKLKVGLVSTMEHVATLTRELKEKGHVVMPLPELGDRYSIPPSCQVIVCRVQGTSHRAVDICLAEARKGNRPVIFRNGTTRIMQKIQEVVDGDWEQDQILPFMRREDEKDLEDLSTAEVEQFRIESERKRDSQVCREALLAVIAKGNVFMPALLTVDVEAARDVVCTVRYASRDRVKRVAFVDALTTLANLRSKMIEEQVRNLPEFDTSVELLPVWWMHGKEKGTELLAHGGMTDLQLDQFLGALNKKLKNIQYSTLEPEIHLEPEMIEKTVVAPAIAEPAFVDEPKVKETASAHVIKEPLEGHNELNELIEMLVACMDSNNVTQLPSSFLHRFGLDGTMTLNIVHMAGPDNTCCAKAGARISTIPSEVTCTACCSTALYKYAEMLFSTWVSK